MTSPQTNTPKVALITDITGQDRAWLAAGLRSVAPLTVIPAKAGTRALAVSA